MRIQVFVNTPAHVHVYKHAVAELESRGHEVRLLARDYGCTIDLLEYYDLPYECYGYCGTSQRSLLVNLPSHYLHATRATRRFDPDVVFGVGAYAAHAGTLARVPVVLLLDSEPTSLDHAISRPFARAILTPNAFGKDLGDGHYVFDGFKESAYLHPDVFSPRTDVRERIGLDRNEPYALVRLNAFGSHHDVGKGGFSPHQRRRLVRELAEYATVLVSDEGGDTPLEELPARPYSAHPALLHDTLAEASLLVADTQTMVTEAALLGTPAIRSNAFVGDDDMGNFQELEGVGLVENVAEFETVLESATSILADDAATERWQARRDAYVADMADLTSILVDVAETAGQCDSVSGLTRRGATSESTSPRIDLDDQPQRG